MQRITDRKFSLLFIALRACFCNSGFFGALAVLLLLKDTRLNAVLFFEHLLIVNFYFYTPPPPPAQGKREK
jgi:hypothetical protein